MENSLAARCRAPSSSVVTQTGREVAMVGFNLLNPSARNYVLPHARQLGIGTLVMFAVRRALSRPERLHEVLTGLVASGDVSPEELDAEAPLNFLLGKGGAQTVVDAAYRFCRHEPGVDVVLTGTGRIEHLDANLRSLVRGPLPKAACERLRTLFGRVNSVSGH